MWQVAGSHVEVLMPINEPVVAKCAGDGFVVPFPNKFNLLVI
jgi:hypothetical protein